MSTSPVAGLGPGLHVLPSAERAAALNHLAASLAILGDAASRASEHSRDVRLHVVACQAQHLAGEVLDLLPAHDAAGFVVPDPAGLPAAATAVRGALDAVVGAAPQGGILVISGSNPPGVPPDFAVALARRLAGSDTRMFVDTSGAALAAGRGLGGGAS